MKQGFLNLAGGASSSDLVTVIFFGLPNIRGFVIDFVVIPIGIAALVTADPTSKMLEFLGGTFPHARVVRGHILALFVSQSTSRY